MFLMVCSIISLFFFFYSDVLDELRRSKKIKNAKHNVVAYRIESNGSILTGSDDDGERWAGGKLLQLLENLEVTNGLVIVTRWLVPSSNISIRTLNIDSSIMFLFHFQVWRNQYRIRQIQALLQRSSGTIGAYWQNHEDYETEEIVEKMTHVHRAIATRKLFIYVKFVVINNSL